MKHQQSIIFCTHQSGEIVSITSVLGHSWSTTQPMLGPSVTSVMLWSGRDWVQVVQRQHGPHQTTWKCFQSLIILHVKHCFIKAITSFMMLQQSLSSDNHRNSVAQSSDQLLSCAKLIKAAWREGSGTWKICVLLLFLTWCTSFFHKIINTKLSNHPRKLWQKGWANRTFTS